MRRPDDEWRTTEVKALRELASADMLTAASRLGRSPRAIRDKAERLGIPTPRMPHRCYWPDRVKRRARQLRFDGMSVARISESTGVPVGTLNKWIYPMSEIHPSDRTYALERAIALAEQHDPSIVHYLRVLLNEAKRGKESA